ncbi:hypothetical protein OF83DRAFT_1175957 [Amylostereum chailletii]|nr:hypothetical protein OF83DRAFT_1175957 [Amylostereum chailletii]
MSFAFVPRSVAKPSKPRPPPPHPAPGPATATAPPAAPNPSAPPSTPATVVADDEPALLLALALSDHALWTTPSLRDPNRDGFVSLSTLLRTAPPFASAAPAPVAVLKSIRAHAPDAYDVRMVVFGDAARTNASGGYEVRRRDWAAVVERFSTFDRAYWQRRTVYMEDLPHTARSPAGVVRLTRRLLSAAASPLHPVQAVVFPHHHQDDPSTVPAPKCKGFALVTLADSADADRLLAAWPWARDKPRDDGGEDGAGDGSEEEEEEEEGKAGEEARREARKFGLRMLAKRDWDALQDEYLAYRARLLAAAAREPPVAARAPAPPPIPPVPSSSSSKRPHEASASPPPTYHATPRIPAQPQTHPEQQEQEPRLDPHAPYPPGCVVYVRNVVPETNKTTLKTLFAAAASALQDAIDYVDYTKGLDTCYLRLASPAHAQTLASHFAPHPTVQRHALDAEGTREAVEGRRALRAEVLGGRREEVYWAQVPEKRGE